MLLDDEDASARDDPTAERLGGPRRNTLLAIFGEALVARRVPCSPVNDYSDLAEDVQVQANEYLVEMEHPDIGTIQEVGVPIQMSRTPGRVRNTAPQLGQHTEEVLLEYGFDWDQIQKFREAAVI